MSNLILMFTRNVIELDHNGNLVRMGLEWTDQEAEHLYYNYKRLLEYLLDSEQKQVEAQNEFQKRMISFGQGEYRGSTVSGSTADVKPK